MKPMMDASQIARGAEPRPKRHDHLVADPVASHSQVADPIQRSADQRRNHRVGQFVETKVQPTKTAGQTLIFQESVDVHIFKPGRFHINGNQASKPDVTPSHRPHEIRSQLHLVAADGTQVRQGLYELHDGLSLMVGQVRDTEGQLSDLVQARPIQQTFDKLLDSFQVNASDQRCELKDGIPKTLKLLHAQVNFVDVPKPKTHRFLRQPGRKQRCRPFRKMLCQQRLFATCQRRPIGDRKVGARMQFALHPNELATRIALLIEPIRINHPRIKVINIADELLKDICFLIHLPTSESRMLASYI